jgi:lysozyme
MNHPNAARFPIWGVDVSHYQGEIDWAAVARVPHIGFAYVKATEGGDWLDPRFAANWRGARRAGLRVGGYHFFTFCRPALEQARHFLNVLPREPDTLPPAVDVELGGNCLAMASDREVEDAVSLWIETVADVIGREPIVYATHEAYDRFLRSPRLRRRVWVRDVWREPQLSQAEPWALWQFDARARIAGIPTFVDLDVFRGGQVELQQL